MSKKQLSNNETFGYLKTKKDMRKGLSLNPGTSVKSQYSLKNLFLSFSITLFIASILFVIHTIGFSEKTYASPKSEITYKLKKQLNETEKISSIQIVKK